MNKKTSVVTVALQGCFGCHVALLDLHEELLDVLNLIDIKASPIMDIKDFPKTEIAIIEGCVANEENIEVLKRVRENSKILVALGTCACFGGIPGLRNLNGLEEVLDRSYKDTERIVDGKVPNSANIPNLLPDVKALSQVVKVDYTIPGCPPVPKMIKDTLVAILNGKEPQHPNRNLCYECHREHQDMLIPKREFLTSSVVSYMELEKIDPTKCFLEQGVICMGPATREGCGARCLKGNTPCRGCMGPTPKALEQGAKMINALATILPAGGMAFTEDIVGIGYRFSTPVSIFPSRRTKQ